MDRRRVLYTLVITSGLGALLGPLLARAGWNAAAFAATDPQTAMQRFFGARTIRPHDGITLSAHDLVEDGAVVPLTIETSLPDVTSITILVENNPNPLIASFHLGPGCRPAISTRIKVGEPSDVIAVVESGGELFSARRFLEVREGGCG